MDLWAGDEVHFQQFGSRCRMWIPPEVTDPVLWHPPTRKSVGYFGAVRLRDGKLVYDRQEGRFNKETYFRFLQLLRRRARCSGRRVVVIVDNASYHHARLHKTWRDLHAANFQLYYLPPYSPELNPIERVWKLTRRKCLHNQYFSRLDQVTEVVEKQFELWNKANSTLRQLCAITYDALFRTRLSEDFCSGSKLELLAMLGKPRRGRRSPGHAQNAYRWLLMLANFRLWIEIRFYCRLQL